MARRCWKIPNAASKATVERRFKGTAPEKKATNRNLKLDLLRSELLAWKVGSFGGNKTAAARSRGRAVPVATGCQIGAIWRPSTSMKLRDLPSPPRASTRPTSAADHPDRAQRRPRPGRGRKMDSSWTSGGIEFHDTRQLCREIKWSTRRASLLSWAGAVKTERTLYFYPAPFHPPTTLES